MKQSKETKRELKAETKEVPWSEILKNKDSELYKTLMELAKKEVQENDL